jgi:hypothetical protein
MNRNSGRLLFDRFEGRRSLVVTLLTLAAAFALFAFTSTANAGAATLSTDKADYAPGEVVHISGTGFAPGATYAMPVKRPDGSIVTIDPVTHIPLPGWGFATADPVGSLAYDYQLNGIQGEYEARAYPATWSGDWSEPSLASVTFTDGTRTFDQCKDDTDNDNAKDPCVWITGDINDNVSAYSEGDSVAFRLWLDGLTPGSTQNVDIRYDFTKQTSGGAIVLGYDFLKSPDASEDALSQRCNDMPGAIGVTTTDCSSMAGGLSASDIPSDGFAFSPSLSGVNSSLAGQAVSTRETPGRKFAMFGGTVTSYGSITKVGDPNTDSGTQSQITVNFTVASSGSGCVTKSGTTTCAVEFLFSGHLAKGTTEASGWGAGRGASSFPGGSLSARLNALTGDTTGATNRSIKTGASGAVIPPGTINIVKNAVPDDPQDFGFSGSGAIGSFSLDDDADGTLPNTKSFTFNQGTYTVSESTPLPAGWSLTDLNCVDPSGGTTTDEPNLTANIDLASGETVTCTFEDTRRAKLIVEKQTNPDGASGSFGFTSDLAAPNDSFSLSDGGTKEVAYLAPGTYNVSENDPTPGFDLSSISCDDSAQPDADDSDTDLAQRKATFNLQAGETVKCTFTNRQRGSIKVVKYHDLNASGADNSEPRLNGWTFWLDDGDGVKEAGEPTQTTAGTDGSGNPKGEATFAQLAPGAYRICEVLQSGWNNSDPGGTAPYCKGSVTVDPGQETLRKFGNYRNVAIRVYKYNDRDGSGSKGTSEPFLNGWTFWLDDGDGVKEAGEPYQSTAGTDGSGNPKGEATFSVKPGQYRICEVLQSGWFNTDPGTGAPPCETTAVLTSGQTESPDHYFGNRKPLSTGAKTIGYWQNKIGQGIITSGASTSGVCNSGTWLRHFAPFQDLSASASCSTVASYVYNVVKAASCTSSSGTCNSMLKAQMLATALDVYFSNPARGGNKIGAPAPIGVVLIDLKKICMMIDGSGGSATCGGSFRDASGAFGGAASLTVNQMLSYAASQSNVGGSSWYGQVKATQVLAKDAFDAINNQVAFGF